MRVNPRKRETSGAAREMAVATKRRAIFVIELPVAAARSVGAHHLVYHLLTTVLGSNGPRSFVARVRMLERHRWVRSGAFDVRREAALLPRAIRRRRRASCSQAARQRDSGALLAEFDD